MSTNQVANSPPIWSFYIKVSFVRQFANYHPQSVAWCWTVEPRLFFEAFKPVISIDIASERGSKDSRKPGLEPQGSYLCCITDFNALKLPTPLFTYDAWKSNHTKPSHIWKLILKYQHKNSPYTTTSIQRKSAVFVVETGEL